MKNHRNHRNNSNPSTNSPGRINVKKKLLLLVLGSTFLIYAKIPPDTNLVTVPVGDSVQSQTIDSVWFSFELADSQSVRLRLSGNDMVREVYLYKDSLFAQRSKITNQIYMYNCGAGRYYLKVDSYVKNAAMSVSVCIDTLCSDSILTLQEGQLISRVLNNKIDHFYRFSVDEPSVVWLVREYTSDSDPDFDVRLWNSDTTFMLSKSTPNTFHSYSGKVLVDSGTYLFELVENGSMRFSYAIQLETEKVTVDEKEDNSSSDSAQTIGLGDSIHAMFLGKDTSRSIDSVDWFKFSLEEERLLYVNCNARHRIYHEKDDSLQRIFSSDSISRNLLLGRMEPGAYYLRTTGIAQLYDFCIADSTPPPVTPGVIDTAHLVGSITFDRGKDEHLDPKSFTPVLDRNLYPENAASYNRNGLIVVPDISDTAEFLSNFTAAFWLKCPPAELDVNIISIGSASSYNNNSSLLLRLLTSSKIEVWSDFDMKAVDLPIDWHWRVKWALFALVVRNDSMTVYINGKTVIKDKCPKIKSFAGVNIGQLKQGSNDHFYLGLLDDIYIFNTALDSAAVNKMIDVDVSIGVVNPPRNVKRDVDYTIQSQNAAGTYTLTGRKIGGKNNAAGQLLIIDPSLNSRKRTSITIR